MWVFKNILKIIFLRVTIGVYLSWWQFNLELWRRLGPQALNTGKNDLIWAGWHKLIFKKSSWHWTWSYFSRGQLAPIWTIITFSIFSVPQTPNCELFLSPPSPCYPLFLGLLISLPCILFSCSLPFAFCLGFLLFPFIQLQILSKTTPRSIFWKHSWN